MFDLSADGFLFFPLPPLLLYYLSCGDAGRRLVVVEVFRVETEFEAAAMVNRGRKAPNASF